MGFHRSLLIIICLIIFSVAELKKTIAQLLAYLTQNARPGLVPEEIERAVFLERLQEFAYPGNESGLRHRGNIPE